MTPGQDPHTSPGPERPLEELIHSRDVDVLRTAAASTRLTEELAMSLLSRGDLHAQVLENLAKNHAVTKHRKVLCAVVSHRRTPRHVSLPLVKQLFTFEMMQIALTPGVAADLKIQIEDSLIQRLESISAGERLTLAKRGSTRVAAALLSDSDDRVRDAALQNPHLTEEWVVKALMRDEPSAALVLAVCRDRKWSLRRDVQIALLRNPPAAITSAWWNDPEIAKELRLNDAQKEQLEQVSTNLTLTKIHAGASGLNSPVRLQSLLASQFDRNAEELGNTASAITRILKDIEQMAQTMKSSLSAEQWQKLESMKARIQRATT